MIKNITFLVVDEHSGQGGLENVLIDVTTGLENLNFSVNVLMLYSPTKKEFLSKFKNISVMGDFIKPHLEYTLPHFIHYPVWKFLFKKKTRSFLYENFGLFPPDAIIILNLSKNLVHIAPILEEYKKKSPSIPIISWPHGTITTLSPRVRRKLQNINTLFDNYFAISKGLKCELEAEYNSTAVDLVYNPVTPPDKSVLRDHKRFIYIGRIGSPEKQVKELLTVLSKVEGDWFLDIIGSSDSEENDLRIINHAKSLGIFDKTKFYGWKKDPWEYINEAGVLLLNSRSEGFGLVLVEAMMRGIPCVSSNCPVGPSEIIIENINGWLYQPDDYKKCQEILQNIISQQIHLPQQELVKKSVNRFKKENVLAKFKECLLAAITKKSEYN